MCVFARESNALVRGCARAPVCVHARAKRPGRGKRIGTQVGSGGPACTRKEETPGPGGYTGGAKGTRSRRRWGHLLHLRRPCRRGKMGTIIRHQGVHPFRSSPLHSYDIYLNISASLSSLFSLCPPAFDQISVTAVSFQNDGEGRAPFVLA